jgi:3-oxoadipate enol-lactonase
MKLSFKVSGAAEGRALLLLHSLGADHRMWEGQLRNFARRYRVIEVDFPGHGDSADPQVPLTTSLLAEEVIAVLDACDAKQADVIGCSLGGMVALTLLKEFPSRVVRVAAANCRLGTPPDAAVQWRQHAQLALREGMEPIADAALQRWFSRAFQALCPEVVARAREMILATRPLGYAECARAMSRATEFRLGRSAAARALLVAGCEDSDVPARDMKAMAGKLAGSRLHGISGAGHLSPLQCPAEFNAAVNAFFVQAEARPAVARLARKAVSVADG